MFFQNKIKKIKKHFKVLEIGPGFDPHPRSDVLLEKKFDNKKEALDQVGYEGKLVTNKKVVYYEGEKFPFGDKKFDYVICSHVLEHVDNVESFVAEMMRVAKSGYIEFPTVYYDYLYNFNVHKNFLLYKDDILYWMKKEDSELNSFMDVQSFFNKTLILGHDQLIAPFKEIFFQGFEWEESVVCQKTVNIKNLCFNVDETVFSSKKLYFIRNFFFFYRVLKKIFPKI